MHNGHHLNAATNNSQQKTPATANLEGLESKDDYPKLDVHGCHEICQSGTSIKYRGFWVGVVFISALAAFISCYNVTEEFTTSVMATKIELKQVSEMLLPKVTVCSIAPDALNTNKLDAYLFENFPNASKGLFQKFATFMLAGSGFQKITLVTKLNSSQLQVLDRMYHTLRGDMTRRQYFYYFFREFGFSCTQLFAHCRFGGRTLNCCEIFEPYYTLRRGYCLSSKEVYQIRADELGKLVLYMRQLPSYLQLDQKSTELLVVFIHQHSIDVAPYPRYYLKPNHFNKMRLLASRVRLKEDGPDKCSDAPFGKGTCYQEHTLGGRLRRLYNCSLPYWPVTKENRGLVACNPLTIAENYKHVITVEEAAPDMETCVVQCDRWEYTATWEDQKSESNFSRWDYQLRLEISYTDLQYEEMSEVVTITSWGFVSQLGGQLGLFLGSSIISLFQLILFIGLFLKRRIEKHVYQPIRKITLASIR